MDSQHLEILFKLCRVCGNALAAVMVIHAESAFLDKLTEMFQVVFAKDDENIHPQKLCSRCHAAIGHFNQANLSVLRTPMIWTKHSNDECTVCIKQNHGRPPKLPKHSGRPKAAVSITVEDLNNWDPSKRVTPEIDKAVSQIFHIKMKQSGSKDNLVTVDSGGGGGGTSTNVCPNYCCSQAVG